MNQKVNLVRDLDSQILDSKDQHEDAPSAAVAPPSFSLDEPQEACLCQLIVVIIVTVVNTCKNHSKNSGNKS